MSATTLRWNRALEMARSDPQGVTKVSDGVWFVRSEGGRGSYKVVYDSKTREWSCDCGDFKDWHEPCKHIFRAYQAWFPDAGLPALQQETGPPMKKRYTQDWHAYNLAQREEHRLFQVVLRALADTIPDPAPASRGRGRPPISTPDQFFCAVRKVYSEKGARRFAGQLDDSVTQGHLDRAPGYVVSSRFFNRADITSVLEDLVTESARPVAALERGFAPDSTGIQLTEFGAWRETKHGERRRRDWLKAHALVGVRTHAIVRLSVTEKDASDYSEFAPLVRAVLDRGFVIDEIYADKGYTGRSNYRFAEDNDFDLYSPFKVNDTSRPTSGTKDVHGRRVSSRLWQQMNLYFTLHREEFDPIYHKRSNVEAVFSALKRKFGENLRSKKRVAQVNELLAKAIAYNITVLIHEIFEHGVVPNFLIDQSVLEAAR